MNPDTDQTPGPDATAVLIVDDDEMICASVDMMLSAVGYSLLTASNGAEAIRIAGTAGQKIDAMLLDLNMQPMSAEQIFGELRKLHPKLPVVFITGDKWATLEKFPGAKGSKLILKPFSRAQLLESIHEAIEYQKSN